MSLLSKHIFISKNLSEVKDLAQQVKEAGGTLFSRSLITFEVIPFDAIPQTDIIFFSSPRGVQFFLDRIGNLSNLKIACVGNTTAQALEQKGINPQFVGDDDQTIEEIAESFRAYAGSASVLFPSSNISLGTISSAIPESQVIHLPVYRTILQSEEIEQSDVYIFTSPSNVRSFFEKNTLPESSLVISWGSSTFKELLKYNVESKKLGTPSVKCLIEYLKEH